MAAAGVKGVQIRDYLVEFDRETALAGQTREEMLWAAKQLCAAFGGTINGAAAPIRPPTPQVRILNPQANLNGEHR